MADLSVRLRSAYWRYNGSSIVCLIRSGYGLQLSIKQTLLRGGQAEL